MGVFLTAHLKWPVTPSVSSPSPIEPALSPEECSNPAQAQPSRCSFCQHDRVPKGLIRRHVMNKSQGSHLMVDQNKCAIFGRVLTFHLVCLLLWLDIVYLFFDRLPHVFILARVRPSNVSRLQELRPVFRGECLCFRLERLLRGLVELWRWCGAASDGDADSHEKLFLAGRRAHA